MSKRLNTTLWIFLVMVIAFSYAWSSFIRTGILEVLDNDYGFNINFADTPIQQSTLEDTIEKESLLKAKKLIIDTSLDHIKFTESLDNQYHFILTYPSELAAPEMSLSERGDYIYISIEHKPFRNLTFYNSYLEIKVPTDNTLQSFDVRSTSGNINLRNLPQKAYENCTVKTTSGNIEIDSLYANHLTLEVVSGRIESLDLKANRYDLTSTSGSITIGSLAGKGTIILTSGNFECNGLSGSDIMLSTTSGNANIIGSALCVIESGSGNIDYQANDLVGDISIETTSGNSSMVLPVEADAKISAFTQTGKVTSDIQGAIFGEKNQQMEISLKNAKYNITISTNSGHIEVQ